MTMILQKVWKQRKNNCKLVTIPARCPVQEGEWVKIIPLKNDTITNKIKQIDY